MSPTLLGHYAVEYHFWSDAFSVKELADYLTHAQQSFHEARFFDSVILSIHPSREGADEAVEIWKERRDSSPLTPKQRWEQLEPHIEGLRSQLSD